MHEMKKNTSATRRRSQSRGKTAALKRGSGRVTKGASKAGFSLRSLHLGVHLAIAVGAVSVLLLLGLIDQRTFSTLWSEASAPKETVGRMVLQHSEPLSLKILLARKNDEGYLSVENLSVAEAFIEVSSDWKRIEVFGTKLSEATFDVPVFGSTRWRLPGKAGMKLLLKDVPDVLRFENSVSETAVIDVRSLDLPSLVSKTDVILVQKKRDIRLWDGETETEEE